MHELKPSSSFHRLIKEKLPGSFLFADTPNNTRDANFVRRWLLNQNPALAHRFKKLCSRIELKITWYEMCMVLSIKNKTHAFSYNADPLTELRGRFNIPPR